MYILVDADHAETPLACFTNREAANSARDMLLAAADNYGEVWYDGMRCYIENIYVEFVPKWSDASIHEGRD